jgi:hypothetical protein
MQVDNLMVDPGPSVYYDSAFRNVLEDFMTYLRTNPSTISINIEPIDAYKYEFDLFSLLNKYNIPPYMHWIVMRVNNFTSPLEVTRKLNTLRIPNESVINTIRQSHLTVSRIN